MNYQCVKVYKGLHTELSNNQNDQVQVLMIAAFKKEDKRLLISSQLCTFIRLCLVKRRHYICVSYPPAFLQKQWTFSMRSWCLNYVNSWNKYNQNITPYFCKVNTLYKMNVTYKISEFLLVSLLSSSVLNGNIDLLQ